MPKYTRMLCWVTPETKDKILEISENLPIVFTDNYEDFRKEINKDSYLVIDLTIAYGNLDKLKRLFEGFPELKFYINSDTEYALGEVCDVFTDFGRYYFPCAPLFDELIENFKQAYF